MIKTLFAQQIQYPPIPGAPPPTTFPELIRYLFNFGVIISGIVALGVLIWAGILYLTSAGDPEKMSQAKKKAFAAFLGLIILLVSYLILTTINPQLRSLQLKKIEPESGIYLVGGGKFFYVPSTSPRLFCENATCTQISEIVFISPPEDLISVFLYDNFEYGGKKEEIKNEGKGSTTISEPKSIYFLWKLPGVYLYDGQSCQAKEIPYPYHLTAGVNNLAHLPSPFNKLNDSISSIRMIDLKEKSGEKNEELLKKYFAILFTDPDYGGECVYKEIKEGKENENCIEIEKRGVSSAIVWTKQLNPSGKVYFYDKVDCDENSCFAESRITSDWKSIESLSFKCPKERSFDGVVRSLKIDGEFGVLMSTEENGRGKCRFFTRENVNVPALNCISLILGPGRDLYDPLGSQRVQSFRIIGYEEISGS